MVELMKKSRQNVAARGVIRLTLPLIGLLMSSTLLLAQEASLTAAADSLTSRIGDWIVLHVQGRFPPNLESASPAVTDSLGPFEILKVEPDLKNLQWTFRLMTLDSGRVLVPPIPFVYRVKDDTTLRRAFSNAVALTISGISVDPQGEIKDIKPPLSAPWKFEDFLPYLIALVVLGGAGIAYYYYRKKKMQREGSITPARLTVPAHKEALAALRELEEKKLWQQGKVKLYYSEVTEIIRRFFERRWAIIALELTSDEILMQMKKVPEARKLWNELQSFFTTADLVKFAKYDPTPHEHEREMQWAYEIVRAMVPPVLPEEEITKKEVEYAG